MSPLNVLIVDDSSVMRSMILRTLELSGLPFNEIHQAAHGQEALDVLDDHWVDLALVDINMPVMNGVEFIEQVRAAPEFRDLAIIVVSTESSTTRIEHIQGMGAEFVHKPFTPEHLREAVTNLTGMSDEYAESITVAGGGDVDF